MAGADWVYGLHALRHLLQAAPEEVLELWVQRDAAGAVQELARLARAAGLGVQTASRARLDALSGGARHQGVVARVRPRRAPDEAALPALVHEGPGGSRTALFLLLDGVQDPHNLGACLRVANGAGARAVVVPAQRAAGLSPVVRKVASGAAESTPLVVVNNLARAIERLQAEGVWVYGLAGEAGHSLYACALDGPVALVLGAEGQGLRRLTRERCDALLRIPMQGEVESLNVSTAAAVCLFETLRQRSHPAP